MARVVMIMGNAVYNLLNGFHGMIGVGCLAMV